MQTKTELIYKDVLAVFILGIVIYYWANESKNFWKLMFLYFVVKQILAHMKYYKLNNRLY